MKYAFQFEMLKELITPTDRKMLFRSEDPKWLLSAQLCGRILLIIFWELHWYMGILGDYFWTSSHSFGAKTSTI